MTRIYILSTCRPLLAISLVVSLTTPALKAAPSSNPQSTSKVNELCEKILLDAQGLKAKLRAAESNPDLEVKDGPATLKVLKNILDTKCPFQPEMTASYT